MNKKGWVNHRGKSWYSIILGILFFVIGGIPILSKYGFTIYPGLGELFIFQDLAIKIALVVGGILLLIDSFSVGTRGGRVLSVLIGILLFIIGAVPLLIQYEMLGFLPIQFDLSELNPVILQGVLAFYGFYLIVDSFLMKESLY